MCTVGIVLLLDRAIQHHVNIRWLIIPATPVKQKRLEIGFVLLPYSDQFSQYFIEWTQDASNQWASESW